MDLNQLELNSIASRELFYGRNFKWIMDWQWLLLGATAYKDKAEYYKMTEVRDLPWTVFLDSDMHKLLNEILPAQKQNAQINGKYKKARLYLFETPSLYVAAACETGDKGSGWFFVEKNNTAPSQGYSTGEEVLKLDQAKALELSQFFRKLSLELFNHGSEYAKDERYTAFFEQMKHEFGKKIKP